MKWNPLLLFLVLILCVACGDQTTDADATFQKNEPAGFVLFDIFQGEGALEEAWDAVDSEMVNEKLAETVDAYPDAFVGFSESTAKLLTEEPQLVPDTFSTHLKGTLDLTIAPSSSHPAAESGFFATRNISALLQGYFNYLDALSMDDPLSNEGYVNQMAHHILSYFLKTYTPEKIDREIAEFITDELQADDFPKDFSDFSTIVGKLFIRTDYPMWKGGDGNLVARAQIDPENHTPLSMGNAVEGLHALLQGLDHLMGDNDSRQAIHKLIEGLGALLPETQPNAGVYRTLIENLENLFTVGGETYENDARYHTDNTEIYSNAELGTGLRELWPYLTQYLIRGDREMGLIGDPHNQKPYPLAAFARNLRAMQWDIPNARIEESIQDLLTHDIWGRDRTTDPSAIHTSFLEHLIFFAALGSHIGYNDGGETGEITDSDLPSYSHGHGTGAGTITINDTLFAMTTHKTGAMGITMGIYDISFGETDYEHLFRSRTPFLADTNQEVTRKARFNYNQNYPVGLMLAGTPGDMGSPTGGSSPLHENGTPVLNAYRPYCATGVEDDNIALNTMSGSLRAAWIAEGPYYYAPDNPESVTFDGRTWAVYNTPAGLTYAWVLKHSDDPATWEYYYPGQFPDQPMEEQASLTVRYPNPTLSLFTSDIDLTGGIENTNLAARELTVTFGDDPEVVIEFSVGGISTRDEIIAKINNAFGKTVCFPFTGANGEEFLQIVSSTGPINLNNTYYNPLGAFFKEDAGLTSEVDVPVEAFQISEASLVSITVDGGEAQTIDFSAPSRTWSAEMVQARLKAAFPDDPNTPGDEIILPFGNGIEIKGRSSDPDIGRVTVTNLSGSGVQELFGGIAQSRTAYINRMEHYKQSWRSDYYMGKRGDDYYTIGYNHNGDLEIYIIPQGTPASSLVVDELIADNGPQRLCASQEEAIFRNYQFFFADRKFVLVMPIYANALDMGTAVIFQVMEANGYTGFMNGRKYLGNQVWAKKRDRGRSTIPGDYRMCIRVENGGVLGSLINEEGVYNDTIDHGVAFNAVFPHNAPVIYRLGFPRAPMMNHGEDAEGSPIIDYLVGSREFEVGDAIWQQRNATLILLQALWGALHHHTEKGYEPTRSGMSAFFDMVTYLAKPLFYFQKNDGDWPRVCWKPRLEDGHNYLKSSAEFYGNGTSMTDWYGSQEERHYYRPAKIQTLLTVLIDSDPYAETPKRCDGLLASLTAETSPRLLTPLLSLLQRMGDDTFNDETPFTDSPESWGPRRQIFYGLEQIVTAVRLSKAPGTQLNENKTVGLTFPSWLFAQGPPDTPTGLRDEDLYLDWALDWIIGEDASDTQKGRGLANYPDAKTTDKDWEELTDTVKLLEAFLQPESPYAITGLLCDLLDSLYAKPEPYNSEDLAGLLYALGRIFSRYDSGDHRWKIQGESGFDTLYQLFRTQLPAMHATLKDETGKTWVDMLIILTDFLKSQGLVETLVDDVTISSGWEAICHDLSAFLGKEIVSLHDPLWSTLATLLTDLARGVALAQDGSQLIETFEKYGFQIND